ncbi:hypothetical protein [Peribacillus sp. SCS-155]|uniref:hypothetical protein n=1 Tax=Peribacillus sedimenti TaxID=3115297 RepID=UPI0039063A7A
MSLSKALLSLKPIRSYLGVEKEALDYFTWRGVFDSSQAHEDLADSGIHCPSFRETAPAMIDFYLRNKNEKAYHIQIR